MSSGISGTVAETDMFHSFVEANTIYGTSWMLHFEDSQVPVYSDYSINNINAGLWPGGEAIGSYRATMQPNGRIITDTSTVLPLQRGSWLFGPIF